MSCGGCEYCECVPKRIVGLVIRDVHASTASETEIWDALDDEGTVNAKERPARTPWTELFTLLTIFALVRNLALALKVNSLVISKSIYRLK